MPTISSADLALLRGDNHRSEFYLTPCPATALWSARVNDEGISRGATSIDFDAGTGDDFGAVGEFQELWVGSSAGAYDVGRIRIRSISSGDSGVTGTVTVAANGIVWSNNQHLTFIGWYIPKPIRPFIGNDGTFYKDKDEAYTSENSNPPPVCIAGENRAGFIDSGLGYWEIESQLGDSYAIKSGVNIASYACALVYGAGTPTISINSSTGVGTVQFPTAGLYWLKWSVTDEAGTTQDTYRWYYAHSTDASSEHYPVTQFSVGNLNGGWNAAGWACSVQLHDNATLTDIPDYAPIILWSKDWYGETEKKITLLPDESSTIINGYVREDRFSEDLERGTLQASFQIGTIQSVYNQKFNYSVSLEVVDGSPDAWWKYEDWMTPTRAVHHYLKWHSAILEMADVIGLNSNTDPIAYAEFQDGNVLEVAHTFLKDRSIRASLVCDAGSRLHCVEDVQLLPDSERSGLTQVMTITDPDKSGEVEYIRRFENQSPFAHVSGFVFDGTFTNGQPNAAAVCAIAPGDDPLEDGPSPISLGKQTFTGQTHANQIAGRVLAAVNNEFPEIRVQFSGNYLGTLGTHLNEVWQIVIATGDTARGIAKTLNLILRDVTANVNTQAGFVTLSAVFEAEANGDTGTTTNCPEFPDLDGGFEIPEENDLPGAIMTAASVNYLPPQTGSWTVRTAEATSDMYPDPFWPTIQETEASVSGIVWRSGVDYIKRSTDGGQTWSDVTPPSIETGTDFVMGDASFLTESEHVYIGRWEDAGDWYSRIFYTADDGVNWTTADMGSGLSVATTSTFTNHVTFTDRLASVNMSDTRVLSIARDDGSGISVLWEVDGTTITELDHPAGWGSTLRPVQPDIVRISDTHAVVCHGTSPASNGVRAFVVDITGDTISYGSEITLTGSSLAICSAIAQIADDQVLVVYSTASDVFAQELSISGTTITEGSKNTVVSSTAANDISLESVGSYVATDLDKFLLTYRDGSDSNKMKAQIVNLGTFSASAKVEVDSTAASTSSSVMETRRRLARISDSTTEDTFLLAYISTTSDTLKLAAIDASGTSPSVGTPINATIDSLGPSVAATSSSNVYVCHGTEIDTDHQYLFSVTVSGTTVTTNDDQIELRGVAGQNSSIMVLGNGNVVASVSYGAALYMYLVTPSGGGLAKALGISTGKGAADTFYVTYWADDELGYEVRSLVDLSLTGNYSLGACTEAELDALTYVAYPYSPFGWIDDANVYIYGRMNNPSGLGTVHVIHSTDYGATLASLEDGWGADHCGSLVDDFGTIYAIRNIGSSCKLYAGTVAGGLTVKSTLPFSANVNPRGMIFDWFDWAIYAASASSGESQMVVKSNSPFEVWEDLTYDHSTAAGVNAILKL